MSHHMIVVNANNHTKYDYDSVLLVINETQGIRDLTGESAFGSVIRGTYLFQNDITTFELSADLERISLSGTGVAAMQFALELKANLKQPLRVFDTSYTFDILLDNVHRLIELDSKVINGERV